MSPSLFSLVFFFVFVSGTTEENGIKMAIERVSGVSCAPAAPSEAGSRCQSLWTLRAHRAPTLAFLLFGMFAAGN